MQKLASIHLRRGRFYVDSNSKTTSGFWIGVGEVQVVDASDLNGVASALRSALDASRSGVPTPSPNEDLAGPLLAAAGVKSWRTFVRQATFIDALLTDGKVTLTPYRKADREGYVPLSDKAQTVRVASDQLGIAVAEAFANAE